jgi:hypothetical protein
MTRCALKARSVAGVEGSDSPRRNVGVWFISQVVDVCQRCDGRTLWVILGPSPACAQASATTRAAKISDLRAIMVEGGEGGGNGWRSSRSSTSANARNMK